MPTFLYGKEVAVNPSSEWPDEAEEGRLLTRLSTGTPTAREELASRFHPLLLHFLARAFPRAAEDLRGDAADRALIDFLRSPDRFDAGQLGLGAFLRMSARGDLLNLLERERRASRGIPLGSVEEPEDRRNQQRDDDEPRWDHPALAAELAALDAEERLALELMREGVRRTAAFVERLNLGHLGADERTAAVMRLKDRVKRRLTRAVEDSR
jgi:RNA polymerase sigma factor (sigma-70 family)